MAVAFAVVREDPALEAELVRRTGARAALVVASGGCTALELLRRFPTLDVTAFDRNPAQLAHLRAKARAAAAGALGLLNVEDARADGLSQRGVFEKIFRLLRAFLVEFVAPAPAFEQFFSRRSTVDRAALLAEWTASKYWPIAFAHAFDGAVLEAMFGKDATQHAAPGSYPGYFRRAFEAALGRPGAGRNPFLQHVLLGRYRAADAPGWMRAPPAKAPRLIHGSLLDVPALGRFEVISLSNVFDWSGDALVERWARRLANETRPGTVVLIRQLNNRRPLRRFFAPAFRFDAALGRELLAADRSFFYERILVAVRS